MAVALPTEHDKDILLAYMKMVHNKPKDRDGSPRSDLMDSFFHIKELRSVASGCECVLAYLGKFKAFFTISSPLLSHGPLNAFGVEDMEPFAAFSVADIFSRQSPFSLFEQYKERMEVMQTELLNSRDRLAQVNARNAFIWTTDVSRLRQCFRSRPHGNAPLQERRKSLTSVVRANSTAHISNGDENGKDKGVSDFNVAARPSVEQEEEVLSDALLLSLKPDELPSEMVKASYAKFIQACVSFVSWLTSVLDILNGVDDVPKPGRFTMPPGKPLKSHVSDENHPRSSPSTEPATDHARTVTVRCFEIHDAYQIYSFIVEQAAYFFQPACTQYDARIQRRLLQSSYFHSVRELMDDLTNEINHLKEIAQRRAFSIDKKPNVIPYNLYAYSDVTENLLSGEHARVFFRPPLSYFTFLRASLQLYLSICVNEDDITSFLYFQHLYKDFLTEARDVAHNLQRLPKTYIDLPLHSRSAAKSPTFFSTVGREIRSSNLRLDKQQDHQQQGEQRPMNYASNYRNPPPSSNQPSTAEEQDQLQTLFEAYWSVREKVNSLKRALEKDIRSKDLTHRTRTLASVVEDQKGLTLTKAERKFKSLMRTEKDNETTSIWSAAKNSVLLLSQLLTCQAEMDFNVYDQLVGNVDSEGILMTAISPCHDEKTEILKSILYLSKIIEIQGVQLEKKYPNHFSRGIKSKWVNYCKSLAKSAKSVSVIFGP